MPARVLFFDLDGVLVDSRVTIEASLTAAMVAVGEQPPSPAQLALCIGPPLHEIFGSMLLPGTPTAAQVDACVAAYHAHYREICETQTPTMPGIDGVLTALGATAPLVVATSKPKHFAELILRGVGLANHFLAIVGPGLTARGETKLTTLERAAVIAAELGHAPDPQQSAMTGDRLHDMHAAKSLGMRAIGALWGYGSEQELLGAGADVLVAEPAGLVSELAATA